MSPQAGFGKALSRSAVLAGVIVVLVALAGGWWATTRDSRVAFLASDGAARWIVFPRSARIGIRPAVDLETRFRRSFRLEGDPEAGALRYRAFRGCEISVNGSPITLPDPGGSSWKRPATVDVTGALRAGENELLVRVRNDRGPPALWLDLSIPDGGVVTDESWTASLAGSVWRAAQPARAGYVPSRIDPDIPRVRPGAAIRSRWPALLSMALVAAVVILGVGVLARALGRRIDDRRRTDEMLLRGCLALVVASWVVIFVNNAPSLWIGDGFDAEGHVAYVQFILDHGRLPAAEQGWSMFQPPLYYLASAATLKLAGLSTLDAGAGPALRMLGLLIGVGQLLLLHACLGRIFPGQVRARAVGLIVAAFLPLQLYTFQYVGNDAMAAMLGTAVVYVGLRILSDDRSSIGAHVLLGALIGAAVLSKLSALIVAAVVILVMAGKRVLDRSAASVWARSVGVSLAASLALAAWHYAPMAWRYGSPMVGNWDPAVHASWWQDPGVMTARFYTVAGRSLSVPLLSAYNSFADGIYTTLWGDGLIGGRGEVALAPPWNLELMAAGYVLALAPTVLVLVGAVLLTARLVRRPDASGFVVVGIAAATAAALAVWPLKIPIYSVVKASFGMPALVSLCAFAAVGFETLCGRRRWLQWLGWVAIGTWAVTSVATFWIPRYDPRAEGRLGWILAASEITRSEANAHLRAALDANPHEPLALLGQARMSVAAGREDEAIAQLRALVSSHGDFLRGRLELARLLSKHRRYDGALDQLRAALEVQPDLAQAHSAMGEVLSVEGEREMAIEHYREALRVVPDSSLVHRNLGRLLIEFGWEDEGRHHLREAERLQAVVQPGS